MIHCRAGHLPLAMPKNVLGGMKEEVFFRLGS